MTSHTGVNLISLKERRSVIIVTYRGLGLLSADAGVMA